MDGVILDERTRLAIEVALTAGDAAPLRQRQEAEARRLGLCGAEIDAMRQGRSFDMRVSIALALATATSDEERERRRARAIEAGIGTEACRAIEALADRLAVP